MATDADHTHDDGPGHAHGDRSAVGRRGRGRGGGPGRDGGGPDEVARDEALSEVFWSVARQLRHQSRETLAPWDISPSHSRAIVVLSRGGAMRLSELAGHLHIAPRSATEVVDALEDRGFVQRTPDPGDRRATVVTLTSAGIDLAAEVRATRNAEAERFFGTLSEDDRAHLIRILRTLRE